MYICIYIYTLHCALSTFCFIIWLFYRWFFALGISCVYCTSVGDDVGCLLRSSCARLFHCLDLLRNWLSGRSRCSMLWWGVVELMWRPLIIRCELLHSWWRLSSWDVIVWSFLKNYKLVRIINIVGWYCWLPVVYTGVDVLCAVHFAIWFTTVLSMILCTGILAYTAFL
jgi:hypothetical protein